VGIGVGEGIGSGVGVAVGVGSGDVMYSDIGVGLDVAFIIGVEATSSPGSFFSPQEANESKKIEIIIINKCFFKPFLSKKFILCVCAVKIFSCLYSVQCFIKCFISRLLNGNAKGRE